MNDVTYPKKGETVELEYSKEARHRLVIGLSWDHNSEVSSEYYEAQVKESLRMVKGNKFFKSMISKKPEMLLEKMDLEGREEDDQCFDLDLSCFAYDESGTYQALVDPSAWNAIDKSGKIYHSGDDMEGRFTLDDEQVHVELRDMPDHLRDFFFVVESDCMHSLKDIVNPEIRIADSKTESNLLHVTIDELPESGQFAYVFCRVFWEDGKWFLQNISEFTPERQDWVTYLKKYI